MPSTPTNKKLYNQVVADAKKRFKVWPSAYASGWVVHRYKTLGGTYKTTTTKKNDTPIQPLDRWFKQEWIDVCKLPDIVPCGRKKAHKKDYPYCRPLKRITKKTPRTVNELTPTDIKERCEKKRKNPNKRVL